LGHLPGAVNISGFSGIPRAENGDMAEPEASSRLENTFVISKDMTLIVYDAHSQMMGTVAWASLYYGHSDVPITTDAVI
jgi:3-mercaptopyruvate sulfurtransferase SseA